MANRKILADRPDLEIKVHELYRAGTGPRKIAEIIGAELGRVLGERTVANWVKQPLKRRRSRREVTVTQTQQVRVDGGDAEHYFAELRRAIAAALAIAEDDEANASHRAKASEVAIQGALDAIEVCQDMAEMKMSVTASDGAEGADG